MSFTKTGKMLLSAKKMKKIICDIDGVLCENKRMLITRKSHSW